MRAPRLRFLAAAAIAAFSLAAFADTTPPIITPNVTGTLGSNGWYVSDVTLSWDVRDDESPILLTSGCQTRVITTDTSGSTFTCSATSLGGTSHVSQTIRRDTAGPDVVFTGNLGTYTVDQDVEIFCNTFDALSGVAMTTCGAPLTGAAYSFPLETPVTQTVIATDHAGNTTTATLVFVVDVTYGGVSTLVDRFVTKDSVARSLQRSLATAQNFELLGKLDAELRALTQFTDRVARESGKNIAPADAEVLLRVAQHL